MHYRYLPTALSREPDFHADTLYVIGGLYGNRRALATALDMAAQDSALTEVAFNGDFHWFDIDDAGFAAINDDVLRHRAIRGNVETEIAGENDSAGCGCGYPDWVSDAEVARSNAIIERLRATARRHLRQRRRLAALPMHLVAEVAGMHVAIVHGDAESLAGWSFAQESLDLPATVARLPSLFERAEVRVFASSHTCLPVATDCDSMLGRCVLINNGAAGMPNFAGTTFGLLTRISAHPCDRASPLYGTRLGPLHIDALPIYFDQARWCDEFIANWPPDSPAHASYFRRIVAGPAYHQSQAQRWCVSRATVNRPMKAGKRGARDE